MKIFGKEINLNGKNRTIAIVVAVVMVAVLATAVFAGFFDDQRADITTIEFTKNAELLSDPSAIGLEFTNTVAEDVGSLFNDNDSTYESGIVIKSDGIKPGEKLYIHRENGAVKFDTNELEDSVSNAMAATTLGFRVITTHENVVAIVIAEKNDSSAKKVAEYPLTFNGTKYSGLYGADISLPISAPDYLKLKDNTVKVYFTVKDNVTVTKTSDILKISTPLDKTVLKEGVNSVERGTEASLIATVQAGKTVEAEVENGANVNVTPKDIDSSKTAWTYEVTVENVNGDTQINLSAMNKTVDVKFEGVLDETGKADKKNLCYSHTLNKRSVSDGKYEYGEQKNWGEAYSFVLVPDEGHEYPVVTYKVGRDGTANPVKQTNGTYIIPKLTDDTTITIAIAAAKTYHVSWTDVEGATIEIEKDGAVINNGQELPYDTELKMKIKLAAAYDKSKPNVSVNGRTVSMNDDNTYTIKVAGETTIGVSNIKLNTYEVKYVGGNNNAAYTTSLTASQNVVHNSSITFSLAAKPGYEEPVVNVVKTEHSEDKPTVNVSNINGNYTISGITEDITIQITPGQEKSYKLIGTVLGEGAEIAFSSSDEAENVSDGQIKHGKDLTVTVTVKEGYNWDNNVTVNGTNVNVTADANNAQASEKKYTYKIDQVTNDVNVVVSGLSAKTYTVSMPALVGGVANVTQQTVMHGGNCTFNIQLNNGYTVDDANLKAYVWDTANGKVVSNSDGDSVIFNAVTGSITITCHNVKGNGVLKFTNTSLDGIDNSFIRIIKVNASVPEANYTVTPVISNSNVQLSLQANPGYKINEAKVKEEKTNTDHVLSYAGNGLFTTTLTSVYSDLQVIDTIASPIVVNVTYATDPVQIGQFGSIPSTSSQPETYNVTNSIAASIYMPDPVLYNYYAVASNGGLTAEANGLRLTLDTTKFANNMYAEGSAAKYFKLNNIACNQNGLNVLGNNAIFIPDSFTHDDLNITVTANYIFESIDDRNIPFVAISAQPNGMSKSDNGVVTFRWTSTLTYDSSLSKDLTDALTLLNYKVDSYGFALGKQVGGSNITESAVRAWAKNAIIGADGNGNASVAYKYEYYDNTAHTIGIPGWVNYFCTATESKMNTPGTGSNIRCGWFWYRVNIGGTVYVHLVAAEPQTWNVGSSDPGFSGEFLPGI